MHLVTDSSLSLRLVEELLLERGIARLPELIRQRFGQMTDTASLAGRKVFKGLSV